jgi:hypothetical protein
MSNAFTKKPDVSRFVRDLERNQVRSRAATLSEQERSFPQTPHMRPFTLDEKLAKEPRK